MVINYWLHNEYLFQRAKWVPELAQKKSRFPSTNFSETWVSWNLWWHSLPKYKLIPMLHATTPSPDVFWRNQWTKWQDYLELCHKSLRVLKMFPGPGYLHSKYGVIWLCHLLVNLYIWLTISSCYGSRLNPFDFRTDSEGWWFEHSVS